ncbi:hypothetical protein [Streptomyces sp. NPDC017202]|uniref:hypothetical protein n=1 Tax=Streptomyces sp. NPDC017202 TaxID=3364981 RepID=UPI0037B26EED
MHDVRTVNTASTASTARASSLPRLAASSLAGTAVEFYDFFVYGFVYGTAAALVLGPLSVPTFSSPTGTPAAFATFGAGFVARPLCLVGCAAAALWMFPLMALLGTGEPLAMFLGFLGAMLAFVTMFAVVAACLPELHEPRIRWTGAAVGHHLGGALTPLAATALAERSERVPWGARI